MRVLLLLVLLQAGFFLSAQNRCATADYTQLLQRTGVPNNGDLPDKNPGLLKQVNDNLTIRIPVVIHLLYNGATQGISDAQIKSGIAALNRDFRRQNADSVNTPARFRSLAADINIEFYLATADPLGRPTTGIVRKPTSRVGWMADDKMKLAADGGDNAWDSKSYLNIWLVNLVGGSGYSSLPGANAATDGVVINHNAFGTVNTSAPFNLGRTAVHEVGHWLGLRHIWGDTQCGDDGIDDTPQQGFFTQGCPSGFRSSCHNGEAGDMYMNFMDYTNDACMNLFTQGQRTRMRSLFADGGARASLLQSRGLSEPWAAQELSVPPVASLYPNPAFATITLDIDPSLVGKKLLLFNSHGQLQKEETMQAVHQSIAIDRLTPGVYFLKGEGYSQKFVKL